MTPSSNATIVCRAGSPNLVRQSSTRGTICVRSATTSAGNSAEYVVRQEAMWTAAISIASAGVASRKAISLIGGGAR